ncbi:uncharacterized protein LOC142980842 isoform X2 [Anticarsia gemmatalis]|uniref:uncharacterized protein LOC142980842 isoform X2 n=1 Tax=Anticarsia gemmatalis TaxID=129554 RepID=UPI003F7621F5
MRLTGSRAYYRPSPPKMPPGLVELMEGLTKEVLKHNPTDIYGFCAGHVQQLLEKRDGPSRTTSLSLEEKIARAQEKVRQRAEKRRQAYDENFQLWQQSTNDANSSLIADQQQVTEQDIQTSNDNSNKDGSLLSSLMHISLKPPVHHEIALEKSSEVEIAHDSTLQVDLSQNIAVDKDKANDEVPNDELARKDENMGIENEEKDDVKEDGVVHLESDIETTCKDVGSLDNTNTLCSDGPEISPQSPIPRQSNDSVEDSSHTENANTEPNPQIKQVETVITDQNLTVDTGDTGSVAAGTEIVDIEGHNSNENHLVETAQKPIDNDVIHQLNDHNPINTENAKDTHSLNHDEIYSGNNEDSQRAVDTNEIQEPDKTENVLHKNTTDLSNTGENDNVITESFDKESPQTQSVEVQSLGNTDTIESDPVLHEIDNINDQGNNETGCLNDNNETLKEPPNRERTEHESPLDLTSLNVDGDISTLVTDGSIGDVHHVVKNTTKEEKEISSDGDVSKIDNRSADHNKETDNNLNDHDGDAHSKNTISSNDNISKGDNMGENSQNDNTDASNMDLETAAVTIQKVFRTFLFKSRGSTFEDSNNEDTNFLEGDDKNKEECDFPIASALSIERRAHGLTRMDTVLQTVNEEKSLSLSDDSSTLSSAATIIQAHVRGFLVRNKLNSNKTVSTNSLVTSNSNEPSITSLEADNDQNKNKTILNIHIVPEGENYLSRDESLITSMELSLDSSPPSSINLHPLGYDKSERRKQLKREDAIQSISPPSNNSGKLSEDFDSVKELSLNDHDHDIVGEQLINDNIIITKEEIDKENGKDTPVENGCLETTKVSEQSTDVYNAKIDEAETQLKQKRKSFIKMNSDEMDVVTPYISNEDSASSKLTHSGEFHDAVLPTRVSRSDTTVVSGE